MGEERLPGWDEYRCFGCSPDNPSGLGLEVHHAGDGTGHGVLRPRPEHEGPPGHLHGGLAATALDETMAWIAHETEDEACVTATLSVRYRKPVPLGDGPYRIEVETLKAGERRRKMAGRLLLGDGTVAVEAEGVFVKIGTRGS